MINHNLPLMHPNHCRHKQNDHLEKYEMRTEFERPETFSHDCKDFGLLWGFSSEWRLDFSPAHSSWSAACYLLLLLLFMLMLMLFKLLSGSASLGPEETCGGGRSRWEGKLMQAAIWFEIAEKRWHPSREHRHQLWGEPCLGCPGAPGAAVCVSLTRC